MSWPTFSMTARPVDSFRGEWAPLDSTFSDPEVALDEIESLDPRYGPTVVAVSSSDGWQSWRAVGEWLCEPGGGNVNLKDRGGLDAWRYTLADMEAFRLSRSEVKMWEARPGASLMYAAAARPTLLASCVAAAADCAESVLPVLLSSRRSRGDHAACAAALAAARSDPAGARGAVTAAFQALTRINQRRRAAEEHAAWAAARAAAWAAELLQVWAAHGEAGREELARVARSASEASLGGEAPEDALDEPTADIVRRRISSLDYLRAVAT